MQVDLQVDKSRTEDHHTHNVNGESELHQSITSQTIVHDNEGLSASG